MKLLSSISLLSDYSCWLTDLCELKLLKAFTMYDRWNFIFISNEAMIPGIFQIYSWKLVIYHRNGIHSLVKDEVTRSTYIAVLCLFDQRSMVRAILAFHSCFCISMDSLSIALSINNWIFVYKLVFYVFYRTLPSPFIENHIEKSRPHYRPPVY